MSLERGRISTTQLVPMIGAFTIGSSLVLLPGRGHDSWIAVLLGSVEGLGFASISLLLTRRFPRRTFDEIAREVFGPLLGRLFAFAFLLYLFHLGSLVLGNFAYFFRATFMAETPIIVFSLLLSLVAASAARNGVEVIARCAQLMFPVSASIVVVLNLLLVNHFQPQFFLPIRESTWADLARTAHAFAAFPLGEVAAFLMVLPFLNRPRQAPAAVAKGLAWGVFLILAVTIRSIGVLGPSAYIYAYPNLEATRLIDIGRFFTRLEILVAINLLAMGFIKVSILLYGAALGAAQLLGLQSYLPLVWPLAVLMALLSVVNYPNSAAQAIFALYIYPYFAPIFQVGWPLLALLAALLRGSRGRRANPQGTPPP